MRRVLLALVGMVAAGASHAEETYSFTNIVNGGMWHQQTLIRCTEPARMKGRVPERCTLSERATALPQHEVS